MKKNILLLFLLAANISAFAAFTLDAGDFSAKFKTVFELARKRFATEKSGEKKTISEGVFVAAYDAKTSFNGADLTRIVVDADGILGHHSRFNLGASKEEAKKVYLEMLKLVKANLPVKFIARDTYESEYMDGIATVFEYDSEVFAQQAKHPAGKLGVRIENGNCYIHLLINEPIFK